MEQKKVYTFILLMGVVSLLGDIIYEGTRGITGSYLHSLGSSMVIVSITSGLGEFLGYSLRLFSGFFIDRLKTYWLFTFLGYGLLISIPLLFFVNRLDLAIFFLLLERIGKGLRSPARDSIVSFVSQKIGRGVGFGITEALDQVGAILGPLIFLVSYSIYHNYKAGFAVMFIPYFLLMLTLFIARSFVPNPDKTEKEYDVNHPKKVFYIYILFSFFSIISVPSYQVISYFFKASGVLNDTQVMFFYIIAMFVDLVFALIIGKLYDIYKFKVLTVLPIFSFLLIVFSFKEYFYFSVIAVILYGSVLAIHESVMRSSIADITHISKRGFSYGVFNFVFGFGYFLGNVIIGFLTNFGYLYLLFFAGLSQLIAIIFLIYLFVLLKKD